MTAYFHGGAPGLKAGDIIEPRPAGDDRHLVDGCPTCEARKAGDQHEHDDNDPTLVYVTTDRDYARIYAAGYPNGALYRVEPIGELVPMAADKDAAPSWGVAQARVLSVYDPVVRIAGKDTRRLVRRFA
jgi:hypothetical protein